MKTAALNGPPLDEKRRNLSNLLNEGGVDARDDTKLEADCLDRGSIGV